MEITLSDEIVELIKDEVSSGHFASEQAVVEAAVRKLRSGRRRRDKSSKSIDHLIDHEFVAWCERELEGVEEPTLEEVLEATSSIPGSMSDEVIRQREERY